MITLVTENLNEFIETKSVSKKFSELKHLIKNLYPKVNLYLEFYRNLYPKNYLYLHKISVPKEYKNSGVGTKIMNMLCGFCDDYSIICKLAPTDAFGSNFERLVNFYVRFGF